MNEQQPIKFKEPFRIEAQDSQPLFPPHLQPVISHPVPTLHIASTPPGTSRGFSGHCYMDTLPPDEQTP